MNVPSVRWMTWSASSLHCELDVPRTRSLQQQRPVARHLQAHDSLAPLGLEARAVLRRLGHPGPAVLERPLVRLGRLALGVHLLGAGVVVIGVAAAQQLVDGGLVARAALRLEIRRVRAADLGAFVPRRCRASGSRAGSAPAPPRRCAADRCRRCAACTCRRAAARYSQLNSAVRTPPMCRKPVGLGANRVRGGVTMTLVPGSGVLPASSKHDETSAGGEDHPFGQAELHLPRLEIRGDHDLATDEHRRIGIVGAQAGENLAQAALAEIDHQLEQFVGPGNDLRGLDEPDAQVDLAEIVDGNFGWRFDRRCLLRRFGFHRSLASRRPPLPSIPPSPCPRSSPSCP